VEAHLINVFNAQNTLIYINATSFDNNNWCVFPVQENLTKRLIERRWCDVVWCCVCWISFSKINLHVTDVVLNICTIVMTMIRAGESGGGGGGGLCLQLS
jgi:hypothetical protein